jgi:predicted dinucleotide-binding enzyme
MDSADRSLVGIIGAGHLGQAMARTALRAGRDVVLANSRGPESLTSVVSTLGDGASAGTVDQASEAGILVIAVPWDRVPEAVQGLELNGQIVIDATNDFDASDLKGRTSSELVADLVPGARVVKAANTLEAAVLGSDPHQAGGERVIFLSGDDVDAKSQVVCLFEDAGFFTIDLGDLVDFFRRVLEDDSARGLYVIGDGANPTVAEITEAAPVAAGAPGAVPGSDDEARARLGDYFAEVLLLDQGTDAAKARAELDWRPSHPGLVDEFRNGSYRNGGADR